MNCRYCDPALRSDAARCDYCGAPNPAPPIARRPFMTIDEWRAEHGLPPLPLERSAFRIHLL